MRAIFLKKFTKLCFLLYKYPLRKQPGKIEKQGRVIPYRSFNLRIRLNAIDTSAASDNDLIQIGDPSTSSNSVLNLLND